LYKELREKKKIPQWLKDVNIYDLHWHEIQENKDLQSSFIDVSMIDTDYECVSVCVCSQEETVL
jgi:hypothetical protein